MTGTVGRSDGNKNYMMDNLPRTHNPDVDPATGEAKSPSNEPDSDDMAQEDTEAHPS
jgi:hypothetical protein